MVDNHNRSLSGLCNLRGEAPHTKTQGLLHAPDIGSMWGTSCPVLLFQVASQDVQRRVVVTIQFRATMGAGMPSDRQCFRYHALTSTALLAGVLWRDSYDFAASLFRFAATELYELSPTRIQNALI